MKAKVPSGLACVLCIPRTMMPAWVLEHDCKKKIDNGASTGLSMKIKTPPASTKTAWAHCCVLHWPSIPLVISVSTVLALSKIKKSYLASESHPNTFVDRLRPTKESHTSIRVTAAHFLPLLFSIPLQHCEWPPMPV